MFPAFKEWHVIVEALAAGEQTLILRKGGIAEGRGGFNSGRASRFWLFPTRFHAQAEKTKPAAARFAEPAPVDPARVTLQAFADVVRHAFVADRSVVERLDPYHLWTSDTVRERFDWAKPPGIHVFLVRVHRLHTAITLPLTPDLGGCKSWIDLPHDFSAHAASPALDDATFVATSRALGSFF